jgi:hypothetical protein
MIIRSTFDWFLHQVEFIELMGRVFHHGRMVHNLAFLPVLSILNSNRYL